jgi:esterase/lipase superfamily enzyme
VTKYTDDEVNVEWTQPHLKKFLETAANKSGASEIFLVAHSMGNRVLTKALIELLDDNPELKKRFKALVLAAPDIDAEIFRRDIAPKLTAAGLFVTLYASCEDKALHLSKNLHGYIRAGDNSEGVCVVPGVEIIDATNLDSGFLGHSYYNESRSVLSDLYYLINRGLRANERFSLEPVDTPSGRYLRFRK